MNIQHEDLKGVGRFYIQENNVTVAEMDYQSADEHTQVIVHTEVDDRLSGQGVGKHLVSAAVDYARLHSLKLKATCTFASKVLSRKLEFADVYIAEKNN